MAQSHQHDSGPKILVKTEEMYEKRKEILKKSEFFFLFSFFTGGSTMTFVTVLKSLPVCERFPNGPSCVGRHKRDTDTLQLCHPRSSTTVFSRTLYRLQKKHGWRVVSQNVSHVRKSRCMHVLWKKKERKGTPRYE